MWRRTRRPFWPPIPKCKISFNLTDQVVDLVREGYDVGIRIGGALDPNFVAVKLATNQRVVCGTPAYFERHGIPQTLEDLARHNCLAFNLQGGQQRGWYFQKDGKPVAIRIDGNLDCNDGELLHRWVSEGLGVGWRSTWEIQSQLATWRVDHGARRFCAAAVRHHGGVSAAAAFAGQGALLYRFPERHLFAAGILDAVKARQRISPAMPGCLQSVSRTPSKRFSTSGNHMPCRKN